MLGCESLARTARGHSFRQWLLDVLLLVSTALLIVLLTHITVPHVAHRESPHPFAAHQAMHIGVDLRSLNALGPWPYFAAQALSFILASLYRNKTGRRRHRWINLRTYRSTFCLLVFASGIGSFVYHLLLLPMRFSLFAYSFASLWVAATILSLLAHHLTRRRVVNGGLFIVAAYTAWAFSANLFGWMNPRGEFDPDGHVFRALMSFVRNDATGAAISTFHVAIVAIGVLLSVYVMQIRFYVAAPPRVPQPEYRMVRTHQHYLSSYGVPSLIVAMGAHSFLLGATHLLGLGELSLGIPVSGPMRWVTPYPIAYAWFYSAVRPHLAVATVLNIAFMCIVAALAGAAFGWIVASVDTSTPCAIKHYRSKPIDFSRHPSRRYRSMRIGLKSGVIYGGLAGFLWALGVPLFGALVP